MSVRSRADTGLVIVLSVLWLPARVVEEGIHTLAALPWATAIAVQVRPRDGTAKTVVRYRDETPEWAIRGAYLAPEVVASLAGVAVITYWLLGGAIWLPATTLDWLLLSVLGAQYLAIALPSAKDADQTPHGGDDRGA